MTNLSNPAFIDDKPWFLAGLLLRKAQPCTPSQLSQECHLIPFTCQEIESLCRLPVSPLCLTECGQVTFSHTLLRLFDRVKVMYPCPPSASVSHNAHLDPQAPVKTESNELPVVLDDTNIKSCHSSTCGNSAHQMHPRWNLQSESCRGKGQLLENYKFSKHYSRKRRREDSETEGVDPNGSGPTAATISTQTAGESNIASSKSPVDKDKLIDTSDEEQRPKELVDNVMAVRKCLQCSLEPMFNGSSSPDVENGSVHKAVAGIEATGDLFPVLKKKEDGEVCMSTSRVCEAINMDVEDQTKVDGLNGFTIANAVATDCFHPQPCNRMDIKEPRRADCPAVDDIHTSLTEVPENRAGGADLAIVTAEATAVLSEQLCVEMDIEESRQADFSPSQINNFTGLKLCKDKTISAEVAGLALASTEASACFSKQPLDGVVVEKESRQVTSPILEMNTIREHDVANVKGAEPVAFRLPKSRVKSKSRQKVDIGKHTHKSVKSKKSNMENQAAAGAVAAPLAPCDTPKTVADLPVSLKQLTETKTPSFEGFAVEAVEGSGGFGTVYKALRKSDGMVFAIKCPFEKTSVAYVSNEIKVLQRYGGRHSIPRCLDVIEESGRQCLVLDYIEHEKPEVLKKEISISDMRWYGYTLFKALAYLHDKGVIHRDVKPGNFLFSCQKNCGSLVDFNLAVVQQKQASSASKSRKQPTGEEQAGWMQHESKSFRGTEVNSNKANKVSNGGPKSLSGRQATDGSWMKHAETGQLHGKAASPGIPVQDVKQSSQTTLSIVSQVRHPEQVTPKLKPYTAESRHGHAVHNVANVSSHRTSLGNGRQYTDIETASPVLKGVRLQSITRLSPSNDKTRISQISDMQYGDQAKEPLPRLGRRELLEYAEKTRHSPQSQVASLSSSLKKRVAAPQKKKHRRSLLDHGLPRRSTSPVSKFSHLKAPITGLSSRARGIHKKKKEGQCAGTKGYRAPEVLLKSVFQNEKIDIWSAGVSLFQLLLGKQPFSSSSNIEQSLIDIAQFCGADAISMLAKEHHCGESLPKELTMAKLPPTSVHIWCQKHTKRSDLLALVPTSLYDLIEKCLQVNPRNRISAKEALKQEFFTPCREPVQ